MEEDRPDFDAAMRSIHRNRFEAKLLGAAFWGALLVFGAFGLYRVLA